MTAQPRPKRRRMGDRLIDADAKTRDHAAACACAAFDEASRLMDRKWGIDRLPALATQDTAIKFGTAIGMLNEAHATDATVERIAAIANACHRGLEQMDQEATDAGAQLMPPRSASCELDGTVITVVQEIADLERYERASNEIVFTAREFAVAMRALKMNGGMIGAVKESFPRAELKSITGKLDRSFWRSGGDVIEL